MVTVAVNTVVPVFITLKEGTLATPLAAKPIDVLLFDHEKVVPATGPDNVTAEDVAPLQ
jgi:hypothetical protein